MQGLLVTVVYVDLGQTNSDMLLWSLLAVDVHSQNSSILSFYHMLCSRCPVPW